METETYRSYLLSGKRNMSKPL